MPDAPLPAADASGAAVAPATISTVPPRRFDVDGRMPTLEELRIRPEPSLSFRVVKAACWLLLHTAFSLHVHGMRELRRTIRTLPPDVPVIYVANHQSWLDGPLLATVLPANPRLHIFAAGENLTKGKVTWWFVKKVGGVIPVDRGAAPGHAVEFDKVYEAMRPHEVKRGFRSRRQRGISLAIFGEAHIGKTEGRLNYEWKEGPAKFGINSGAVEFAVRLNGLTRRWFRRRIDVDVQRIEYPAGIPDAERPAFQAAAVEMGLRPYAQGWGPKLFQRVLGEQREREGWGARREAWDPGRLARAAGFYQQDAAALTQAPAPPPAQASPAPPATAPSGPVQPPRGGVGGGTGLGG